MDLSWRSLWASQVASVEKNPPANAGDIRDVGSIPVSGKSPRGGHSNLLQYYCLENPMDRGAWRSTVHGITKSQTRLKRISTHAIKSIDQNLHFKTKWTSRTKGSDGNRVCLPLPLVFQSFYIKCVLTEAALASSESLWEIQTLLNQNLLFLTKSPFNPYAF